MKLTSEMLAAGVGEIWGFNPDSFEEGHDNKVVEKIFSAMMAARETIKTEPSIFAGLYGMTPDERALLLAAARLLQAIAFDLRPTEWREPDIQRLTAALKRIEEAA